MRAPLAPKTRKKVDSELRKLKKHLADIEKLMVPPVSKKQLDELRELQRVTLDAIAEYEDWKKNGVPILPPFMWGRY